MFAKLLKNEFRATAGWLATACIGAVAAGTVGGISIRFLIQGLASGRITDNSKAGVGEIICAFAILTAVLVLGACGAASLIMLVVRFYQSRFTDEGYLTFTLPVSTHQILLSSLVHILLSIVIVSVVIFGSVFLMILISVTGIGELWQETIGELMSGVHRLFSYLRPEDMPYVLLMAASALTHSLWEIVCLMLAISIGAVAVKKHKILLSVAIYYGIHILTAILEGGVMVVTLEAGDPMPAGPMVGPILLCLALSIGGYFLMHYLVTKKLNLP